jgi:DNA-binding winged helix-turn-helix (wHTH) protein
MSVEKYQSEQFRSTEIRQLFDLARAGESASIIGVSGVGKSNLFNHLLDKKTQSHYLGEDASQYIFLRVNFHYIPDFSDRSIYSLLLDQFELLDEQAEHFGLDDELIGHIGDYHEGLLNAGADLLKAQRYFKLAVRKLLQRSQRALVFLFDQFDEVYQEANPRLLANLRGLREAYKYRVSYFVFTRNPLAILAPTNKAREEFLDLLATNTIGLKPYGSEDAFLLCRRVAERNQLSLNQTTAKELYHLTGGHAGLLRATFLLTARAGNKLSSNDTAGPKITALLAFPDIEFECDKIWNSITIEEQQFLANSAFDKPAPEAKQTQMQLQIKGLLTKDAAPQIFSPLFALYVQGKQVVWERLIQLDESTRRIRVLNRLTKPLTSLEFQVFQLLYRRIGEVVLKDDIVEAGWPDAKGDVSDDAINQVVRRLRQKIEPDLRNPRFLENLRGQGYKLNAI